MEVNEAALLQKYYLVKLQVAGSTQISKSTTIIISNLGTPPSNGKPVIVVLTAKARYANKLISIVEIAKRELVAIETKNYQYNTLSSEMTEIARVSKKSGQEGNDDSDDAFETTGAPNLTGPKKRAVPIMRTYLSTTSVRALKFPYA